MNDDGAALLADERAITRLLVRYNRLADDARTSEIVGLFTEDGRLKAMGQDLQGRRQLAPFFGAGGPPVDRPSSSHLISNVEISIDGDIATSVSDFAVVARQPDGDLRVVMAGRYHDTFRRSAGGPSGWLIAERLVQTHARPFAPEP